jgi:uncharacterized protein (DUF3084 family)
MKVNFVKSARKAIPSANIKIGDSYYWWKFRYGGKRVSKDRPNRSQLTQSDFLSQVYDLEDSVSSIIPDSLEDLEAMVQDFIDQYTTLRDEVDEKIQAMPEHLQETSSSGQLLQERLEKLDEIISELENIEIDTDISDIETEVKEDNEDLSEDEIKELVDEKVSERIEEIILSIQEIDLSF